ncbi:MAG: amidohydrolase [Negativicutes bacterium]|nr:amidohydrolase [Negativicutes bacterium]
MMAITGGLILTMNGPAIEDGTILIRQGKIEAVGKLAVPEGYRRLEAKGRVITPGLIDAHTHLGVYAESLDWAGEDGNEASQPITPAMDVLDAIYPDDVGLADALGGGVTTVMVAPGSANPIGGQCVVIKTKKQPTVEKMVVRRYAGLKIAFGENPRRVYGEQKKMPYTRMATAALIRETFVKAQEYLAKKGDKDHKTDLGLEAVGRVLRGEMPLRAHAHRADDIVTALRIAREFGVEIILEHATEGHLIPEVLAENGAKAVIGPNLTTRSKMELKERSFTTPAVLAAHGVPFALMSDHPVLPCAFLPVYAGLAARFGLAAEQALRAITIDAAELLGVADRVGSLEAGKDADIVIWTGHPLLLGSRPETVIIDGAAGSVAPDQTVCWQ